MRSADRARRDGIRWPGRPDQRKVWDGVNAGVIEALDVRAAMRSVVVVADDVAEWRFPQFDVDGYYGYEQIPDLRLPFQSMWIEYPSKSRQERRAILIAEETGTSSPPRRRGRGRDPDRLRGDRPGGARRVSPGSRQVSLPPSTTRIPGYKVGAGSHLGRSPAL